MTSLFLYSRSLATWSAYRPMTTVGMDSRGRRGRRSAARVSFPPLFSVKRWIQGPTDVCKPLLLLPASDLDLAVEEAELLESFGRDVLARVVRQTLVAPKAEDGRRSASAGRPRPKPDGTGRTRCCRSSRPSCRLLEWVLVGGLKVDSFQPTQLLRFGSVRGSQPRRPSHLPRPSTLKFPMMSSTRISARTGAAAFSRSLASSSSSTPPQRTTFHLPPSTSVFPYGAVSSQTALFRNIGWTIEHDQSWAVVGTGKGRKGLIEVGLLRRAQSELAESAHPPRRPLALPI